MPPDMTRQKDEAVISTKNNCGKAAVLAHRALRRGYLTLCGTVIASVAMQVAWPYAPFAVFGCIVGACFFRMLVIQEKQAAKYEADLEKALARARAAEESRNRFFSIVSHDIRTPLNAILGYSEILRHGITSKAEMDEALDSIRASGTTLLQLVNDVLDLAKMDAGKMTLNPEKVSLSMLTDDVFASFRLAAAEKGISLVDRTAGVPAVLVDAHRFRQILFNLVGNAVKFTKTGSVTVSASYADGGLELAVSDTGCGIPQDMLAHVLDPFVQVQDRSHSADRASGTGLGLSICKSMVRLMGGTLDVESELGKGSTFRIAIHGVKEAEAGLDEETDQAGVAESSSRCIPKSVLVVDDSSVNRKVLEAHLRRAGVASVDFASDGAEALAKLGAALAAGSPHDFVFSDFWMPVMNGLEFVKKLRGDIRFAGLPVFAVTGDTESLDDAGASLFSGVLFKPLTYERLMNAFSCNLSRNYV